MKKASIFLFIIMTLMVSCNNSRIKTGDLLFVDNTSSELSKAINDVTQKGGNANYTHVAICKVENNRVYVYHASPKKNVVKESLDDFYKDRKNSRIDIYRIDKISEINIDKAFHKANSLLNKPYDFAYIFGDESIYCSELIYKMFQKDSIFKLNPMTFKNPSTGKFHESWIKHYEKLNIKIPEGELGCNPNDMSKNSKLRFVRTVSF